MKQIEHGCASLDVQSLFTKKVLVCMGAGGVGKTTSSGALAVAASRLGKRVLVVTIDPSKRLAQALGIDAESEHPVSVFDGLDAWILNPKAMSDRIVRTLSQSEAQASALLKNRIYQQLTSMVAGMQEYTAVEAVHGYINDGAYDLVVLDTPPSQNALDFLQAPSRINRFLEGRIFQYFVSESKKSWGVVSRVGGALVDQILGLAFGKQTAAELSDFFSLFSALLKQINGHAAHVRRFFSSDDVAFLLVSAPHDAAESQARFTNQTAAQSQGIKMSGLIFNRSLLANSWQESGADALGLSDDGIAAFEDWAEDERRQEREHRVVFERMCTELNLPGLALPWLAYGVQAKEDLVQIATFIVARPVP